LVRSPANKKTLPFPEWPYTFVSLAHCLAPLIGADTPGCGAQRDAQCSKRAAAAAARGDKRCFYLNRPTIKSKKFLAGAPSNRFLTSALNFLFGVVLFVKLD